MWYQLDAQFFEETAETVDGTDAINIQKLTEFLKYRSDKAFMSLVHAIALGQLKSERRVTAILAPWW